VRQSQQQTSRLCHMGNAVHSCKRQKRSTEMKMVAVCHVTLTMPENGLCPSADSSDLFFSSFPFSDGYAFSQEEHGVVSQSQVVRSYDTTKRRAEIE